MRQALSGVYLAVLLGSCQSPDPAETIMVVWDQGSVLTDSQTLEGVPEAMRPLIADTYRRVLEDGGYDLSCMQFKVSGRTDDDNEPVGRSILVSHREDYLRRKGIEPGSWRGGHGFCGGDAEYDYTPAGRFIGRIFQR